MILMIDNYDSFTYNLVRYFEILGQNVKVVANDQITLNEIIALKPKAICLSPGPKRPEDAKICIDIVKELSGIIPILGICLGHQVIGYVNGADVVQGKYPVHGKVSQVSIKGSDPIFKQINSPFKVTRYHSLEVKNLSENLEILASTQEGTVMVLKEKANLTYGIQYHPESFLSEFGLEIINNFLTIVKEEND